MQIAICDADRADRAELTRMLQAVDPAQQPVGFADGQALLEAIRNQNAFDLVFLEVCLPDQNGLVLARTLRELSPETHVVFVTNSREYAVEAFSVRALHYLMKPVTREDVQEVCSRMAQIAFRYRPWITLEVNRRRHTVYLDEICYLQSDKHAVEVFMTCGRQIRVWVPLRELEPQVGFGFLRLNRGTIVNMSQIKQMDIDTCTLWDGTRLELTRRERTAIRAKYMAYLHSALSKYANPGEERVL